MSKGMTMQELQARIAQMEKKDEAQVAEIARLASSKGAEPGRIWPDVSKAVKDGEKPSSTIVFRGVNADARKTLNMYPSQFVRFLEQQTEIVKGVMDKADKFTYRSPEEKADVLARLRVLKGKS